MLIIITIVPPPPRVFTVALIAKCLGKDHKPGNTELVDFRY